VRALLQRDLPLVYSVSATTRPPRAGERDGVDYRFLSDEAFDDLVRRDELLEWADVFGHRYGTPSRPVEEAIASGRDVVLEIDVQGARSVRARVPGAVLIFLTPPSMQELQRRLQGRGTEDEVSLERRLGKAAAEMSERGWFDHVVVNDELQRATDEVADILSGYRDRR